MKKTALLLAFFLLLFSFSYPAFADSNVSGDAFVSFARNNCLNKPYVSGGRTLSGFDCCGLVWYVCNHFGIDVGNGNQESQRNYGSPVSYSLSSYDAFLSNLQLGDLIFFDYEKDGVSNHVGIYSGDGKIIQAHRTGVNSKEDKLSGGWVQGSDGNYIPEWKLTCSVRRVLTSSVSTTAILDVNGLLDGEEHGNLENYGTFDVKIKRPGEDWFQWTDDLNDYYESLPVGTQYSIEDIESSGIHDYMGVDIPENPNGAQINNTKTSITGTIGSGDTKVLLKFRTNNPGAEIASVGSNSFDAYIHCRNGLYVSEQGDYNVTALPKDAKDVCQVWHFEMREDNWYTITSVKSGKALYCPPADGWIDGINLVTGDYNSTFEDQLWALHIIDGAVEIGSKAGFFVIDAGYPVGENYTNVYMLHEDSNNNQLYSLERLETTSQLKLIYNSNGATTIKREGQVISEETLTNLPQIKHYSENMSDGLWDGDNSGWLYLERTGYEMSTRSWNTKADGTGISIKWDQPFDTANDLAKALGVDLSTGSKTVTLYMEWKPTHLSIIYNGNGATSIKWEGKTISQEKLTTMPQIKNYSESMADGLLDGDNSSALYLERTGYEMAARSWNTKPDGTGISIDWKQSYSTANDLAKALGVDLSTGSKTVTLYMEWKPTHLSIIYNGNGATLTKWKGETISQDTLTAIPHIFDYSESLPYGLRDGNNSEWIYLERTGYEMATRSWNTKPDGTGISIKWDQTFNTANDLAKALGVDLSTGSKTVTVYMEWKPNTLTIKYHTNGGTITSNTYSTDSNEMVYINDQYACDVWTYGSDHPAGLFNDTTFGLSRTGYQFAGWSRSSDGSQNVFDQDQSLKPETVAPELKSGSTTVTMYAIWQPVQLSIVYNSNDATTIKREGETISEETLTNMPKILNYTDSVPDGLWDGDNIGWLYLERTGYEMATKSWNTKADGTGISVNWYQSFDTANDLAKVLGVDLSTGSKTVTVYMEWQKLTPDFVLPSMLTSIEEEAFAGGAFRFVKLPENAVSIGWHAFAECPNLAYIYIPATVTEIDAQAFGSETNLTIIGASGSVAESFAIEHGFTFMVG